MLILQSGEGLFGLQRALSVAGARTTLLSLWKVDDDATAYFMERYSSLLKQGKGRCDAVCQQNGKRATAEALAENMAMKIGAESGAATGPIPVEAQGPEGLRLNSPEQANFSDSSRQTIGE